MEGHFIRAVNSLSSNYQVHDKLMILSLYNDFYHDVLKNCTSYSESRYSFLLEDVFGAMSLGFDFPLPVTLSADDYMFQFIDFLKKFPIFQGYREIDYLINYRDRLPSLIESSDYVRVIDRSSESFEKKAQILSDYQDYCNHITSIGSKLLDSEKSASLQNDLLSMIFNRLEVYCSFGESSMPVDEYLSLFSKEMLMSRFLDGEFGFDQLNDELKKKYQYCSELERKILILRSIYRISKSRNNEREKTNEICKTLGISKFKYYSIIFPMGIRDIDDFNDSSYDDSSVKIKK